MLPACRASFLLGLRLRGIRQPLVALCPSNRAATALKHKDRYGQWGFLETGAMERTSGGTSLGVKGFASSRVSLSLAATALNSLTQQQLG